MVRENFVSNSIHEKVKNAFLQWDEKPTAVFCCTDSMVPGTVRGIEDAGLSVPNDVSIVGFDGFINASYFYMNIATNIQPLQKMGEHAAEILIRQSKEKVQKKETEILEVQFEKGDSLRDART